MRYLNEQQPRAKELRRLPFAVRTFKSAVACSLVVALAACGGGSDSGGGSEGAPSGGNGGAPVQDGSPSNNNPASGFYERTTAVQVTGAGSDYTVRLRVVIDPGGGVAVFENNTLRSQARIVGNQFSATARGVSERLFGLSCTGDRSYNASVVGTNANVTGNLRGEFLCDSNRVVVLSGSFNLPRTGDHQ